MTCLVVTGLVLPPVPPKSKNVRIRVFTHSNMISSTGHENNIAQPIADKCPSSTSHFFHCLTVVYVSFSSLIKGITPKIRMLCFVLINSVKKKTFCVFGSCVWVYSAFANVYF